MRVKATHTISFDVRILNAFSRYVTEKGVDKNRLLDRIVGMFLIQEGYLEKEFNFNDTPR